MKRFVIAFRLVATFCLVGGFAALVVGHHGIGWVMAALAIGCNPSAKVIAAYGGSLGSRGHANAIRGWSRLEKRPLLGRVH